MTGSSATSTISSARSLPIRQSHCLRRFDELFRHPLQEAAKNALNRQLRANISDDDLAALVAQLHSEGRLCLVQEEREYGEPQIICSLGLV
ncbi:MAG: hypothetical protein R2932_02250 [Caldilineaceae bacterium]